MTKVVFYADQNGVSPALEWIKQLPPKIQDKANARILALIEFGIQLHRPIAAPLRNGIFELRWEYLGVNYRLLYAFHGKDNSVILLGLTKENKVPEIEIERAIERLKVFISNPIRHTHSQETGAK